MVRIDTAIQNYTKKNYHVTKTNEHVIYYQDPIPRTRRGPICKLKFFPAP